MFFSHGSAHSRGVLVLVKDQLDFNLQSLKMDEQGRFILLEATIQDSFLLLNVYAPNKSAEQCAFFKDISSVLGTFTLSQYSVVVGGDFNVTFNPNLDGSGGIKRVKDSVKFLTTLVRNTTWSTFGGYEILKQSALLGAKRIQLLKGDKIFGLLVILYKKMWIL